MIRLPESWVPCSERAFEPAVQNLRPHIEEILGALMRPSHLLFLDHSPADDLVHGGFRSRCGDCHPTASSCGVGRDRVAIQPEIAAKVLYTPGERIS